MTSPGGYRALLHPDLSADAFDREARRWGGETAMPLPADGADARAWARWIRLALVQLGIAGSQGLVSTALREPAGVARVRHRLLAEIAAGPRRGMTTLQTAQSPEFIMFAHYQRGASVWLQELVERGVIAALPPPPARRFEAAMLRHAGVEPAPRPHRTIDLAREPAVMQAGEPAAVQASEPAVMQAGERAAVPRPERGAR